MPRLSLTYEKAMRERNRLLSDAVRIRLVWRARGADGRGRARPSRPTATPPWPGIAARRPGPKRPSRRPSLDSHRPRGANLTADALATALAEGRRARHGGGRTLVGPHRADLSARYAAKGVPADQCSTGEQKALLISLILANARALAGDLGAPPILLLDEVAAHLDEARRAALYDEIVRSARRR